MSRATYEVFHVDPRLKTVHIVDLDEGMSITNDAEAVVQEVNAEFPDYRILYRDTMGNWDELLHTSGVFEGFAPYRK